jgi:hypothetical protein
MRLVICLQEKTKEGEDVNKTVFSITMLLVIGLFIAGCSNSPVIPTNNPAGQQNSINTSDSSPDSYVDEQIIDENSSVEIGEMI